MPERFKVKNNITSEITKKLFAPKISLDDLQTNIFLNEEEYIMSDMTLNQCTI